MFASICPPYCSPRTAADLDPPIRQSHSAIATVRCARLHVLQPLSPPPATASMSHGKIPGKSEVWEEAPISFDMRVTDMSA